MDNIEIPASTLESKFKPITTPPGGDPPPGDPPPGDPPPAKTPEQIAAEEAAAEAARKAAAGAGGGREPEPPPPDPSLLEAADPKLVEQLDGLLNKEDGTLTEEEEKIIEGNEDLVRAMANRELPFVNQLMMEEKYLEKGDFEDTYEGRKKYLEARDKVRDKVTLQNFFAENEIMQKFKEHVIDNKLPVNTFMARVNKPPVLDVKIEQPNETMEEAQRNAINKTNEEIVRANMKMTGVDEITTNAVIESAKTSGTLHNLALSSQANMKTTYEGRIQQAEQQQMQQQKAAEDARKAEIAELTGLVKSGSLTNTFNIPKADEVTFLQYLTTPVTERGDTMADLKYSKLSLGERAALDYIVFKDMKIPSLAKGSVMDRYKVAKVKNKERQVKPSTKGGSGVGLGSLNLREIAKGQNII